MLYRQLGWQWDPELDATGRLIREFQDKDPKASYFRYPVNKDGEPTFERNFSFELHTFCDRVEKLLDFLEGIDCGLAGILDERQEAQLNRY